MSDAQNPNGRKDAQLSDGGILASLPRTRPQRASARRVAARTAGASKAAASPAEPGGPRRRRAAQSPKPTDRATKKPAAAKKPAPTTKKPPKKTAAVAEKPRRARAYSETETATRPLVSKPSEKRRVKPAEKPRVQPTQKPRVKPAGKPPTKATAPPTPKQGYEPEEEVELGATVNPPSGVELVESVADIVGELANLGLSTGGRIFKDAFSLLRRP